MTAKEWTIGELEHAALLEHHTSAQWKADATAASFCGEEGNEERCPVFGRDGSAIVSDI